MVWLGLGIGEGSDEDINRNEGRFLGGEDKKPHLNEGESLVRVTGKSRVRGNSRVRVRQEAVPKMRVKVGV